MNLMMVDPGYIALLTMLAFVPAAAVIAAVVDRIVHRRRLGPERRPLSTTNAFPVIRREDPKSEPPPLEAVSIEKAESHF